MIAPVRHPMININLLYPMHRLTRVLLLLSLAIATISLLAWADSYSPLSCYDALRRATTSTPMICDPRFGLTFIFTRDTLTNILAVVGPPVASVVLALAITWQIISHEKVLVATITSFTAFILCWIFSIWSFDRLPYLCAFGFGGFSCSGTLENLSLNAVLAGWLAPLAALIATPIVGIAYRHRGDFNDSKVGPRGPTSH